MCCIYNVLCVHLCRICIHILNEHFLCSQNLAILYGMLMREEATPLQKLQCVDLFDTLVARRVFYAVSVLE